MTSNAGSNLNNNSIGFGGGTISKNKVMDSLKKFFRARIFKQS